MPNAAAKPAAGPIKLFGGRYNFLSNFHKSPITVNGDIYPTVEHAYQAFKSTDPHTREWVREAESPHKAKQRGAEVTLREGWEDPDETTRGLKYTFMLRFVRLKFIQNPELKEKLLATGDRKLSEGNW